MDQKIEDVPIQELKCVSEKFGRFEKFERRKGKEGEANPVKVIANKHALVRSQLEKAEKELAEKTEKLKLLEREVYVSEGSLQIAEDKLRGINEKLFIKKNSLEGKEELQQTLLKELVDIRWKVQLAEEQYKSLESKYMDFQVEKVVYIDHVNRVEEKIGDSKMNEELKEVKETVNKYREYQERLAIGDEELVHISSGDALVELELRKTGIKDAFARREARVEGIYVEIDEKNEAVEKLKQSVFIKEKQNQARLRKLQRELEDKESTEAHLKQTVEYFDRQIDHPKTQDTSYNFDNNGAGVGKSVYFSSSDNSK